MIGYSVEIVNLPHINARFDRIDRGLESLTPMWERFGREFYAQETNLFDRAPWAALSPAYAKKKREQFGDKPILRATDALFQSFTQQGAAGNVHEIRPLSAAFGSRDFKAAIHRAGTSIMPARDPLAEPDVDKYQTIAGEYLAELVARN